MSMLNRIIMAEAQGLAEPSAEEIYDINNASLKTDRCLNGGSCTGEVIVARIGIDQPPLSYDDPLFPQRTTT